jgi:hypothetical protein
MNGEDLAFIKRFVRASGSLKEVASQYGVSYPTVRRRLDRLIAKLDVLDDGSVTSHFERVLRAAHADGRIDETTTKALLAAYREEEERGT